MAANLNNLSAGTGAVLPKVAAPTTNPAVPQVQPTSMYAGTSNVPTQAQPASVSPSAQAQSTALPAVAPQTASAQPQMDPLAFSTQSMSPNQGSTLPVTTQPATPTTPQASPGVPTQPVAPVAAVSSYQYPTTNPQGGSYYTDPSYQQAPAEQNPMAGLSEQELEAYYTGLWGAQPGWYNASAADIAAVTAKVNAVKQQNEAAQAAYTASQVPQNLDQWWAQHGNGPRYSVVNGTVVDAAQMSYNAIMQGNGAGMTPDIQHDYGVSDTLNQSLKEAEDAQQAAWEYGQTHGGFAPPGYGGVGTGSPNDLPLHQDPNNPNAPFTDANGDPASQGGYAPGSPLYTGGGTVLPPDSGRDTGTPSSGVGGGSAVVNPPATGGGGGGGTTTVPGGGVNTPTQPDLSPDITPIDPTKDLRSFEIKPADLVDRFKLAQQQFGTFADSTQSHYDAALRDAARAAAANGRLGSGMLRTSYGDLANERANSLTTERDTLFQNALLGSVQDAQQQYNNYLAEQAFELGAQDQGFNQAIKGYTLQDQLVNSAFTRAMQQYNVGGTDSPYDMQALMAQLTGGQASSALAALSQLIASQNAANAAKAGASGSGSGSSGGDSSGLLNGFLDWLAKSGASSATDGTSNIPSNQYPV